jgi:hypothetical protein
MPRIASGVLSIGEGEDMTPNILIVREGAGYRILFGVLHLVSALSMSKEVFAEATEEGQVRIVRTPSGMVVDRNGQQLPILGA